MNSVPLNFFWFVFPLIKQVTSSDGVVAHIFLFMNYCSHAVVFLWSKARENKLKILILAYCQPKYISNEKDMYSPPRIGFLPERL